jgi:hypothetical protein
MIKATNMLITEIMANKRVFHPTIKIKGAMNSAIAQRIKEAVEPIPIGSAKLKSPTKTFMNFPYPWVNIAALMPTRKSSNPKFKEFVFMI